MVYSSHLSVGMNRDPTLRCHIVRLKQETGSRKQEGRTRCSCLRDALQHKKYRVGSSKNSCRVSEVYVNKRGND